jgi:hypothetical protein
MGRNINLLLTDYGHQLQIRPFGSEFHYRYAAELDHPHGAALGRLRRI